jgi:hypothetical protein
MIHFFFFGCWNRDHCDSDVPQLDYRKGVFDTLMRSPQNTYDFGIIAGDNVYPHKYIVANGNKEKRYYRKTLEYGYGLLGALKERTRQKCIFATIGNHDVERTRVLEYQVTSPVTTMPHNMYAIEKPLILATYLRILVLDTNIYTQPNYASFMNTMKKITRDFYVVHNDADVIAHIEAYRQKTRNYNGWTIVVGHEPILTIKQKDRKMKTTAWQPLEPILTTLASMEKTVYMCADVHSFQAWNIKLDNGRLLPMVVVGTGGAEPDETLPKMTHPVNTISMELVASAYPYGYCSVKCSRDSLSFYYQLLHGCTETNEVQLEYSVKDKKLIQTVEITPVSVGKCIAPKTEATLCTPTEDIGNDGGGRRSRRK